MSSFVDSGKRVVARLFVGMGISAAYALFDGWLIERIGVSAWANSIPATLAYGAAVTLATAAAIEVDQAHRTATKIALLFAVLSSMAVITSFLAVGLLTGALFGVAFVALVAVGRHLLHRAFKPDRLSLWEAVFYSVTATVGVGAAWVWLTAPAYAEGFVVLAGSLLGLLHLGLFLAFAFPPLAAAVGRGTPPTGRRVRVGRTSCACLGVALVATVSLFYLLWAEGEVATPLEESGAWPAAIDLLSPEEEAAIAPVAAEPLSKTDIEQLLADTVAPSMAQVATLALLGEQTEAAFTFKDGLLHAARGRLYMGPEGSIKYGQRIVMLWAMYYGELLRTYPTLFDADERSLVEGWLRDLVARVFRPGWVDYLYAIPFRCWPHGPYLNQEIGAGAVAALRDYRDTLDTALEAQIRDFEETSVSGWRKTFRNQDDAYSYQDVWMGSALAMHRYAHRVEGQASGEPAGLRAAVEWVKTQVPHHAFPLNYGMPHGHRPLDSLAIGAFLLGDAESRWLLETQVRALRARGEPVPRELTALWLWDDSVKPKPHLRRSALLQAPSGYTFRPGRLRPDKMVLRAHEGAGASLRELYALINLRSSGWHRYPATNTIVRLAYGEDPILVEAVIVKKHGWLPAGRRGHRDKKVDRSRLNGLVVERTGLDAWIGGVTGIYSRWRQDVPRFATPTLWEAAGDLQVGRVEAVGWGGIVHDRLHFVDGSRIFGVVDRVDDVVKREKAIHWHLSSRALEGTGREDGGANDAAVHWLFVATEGARVEHVDLEDIGPPAYVDAPVGRRVRQICAGTSFVASALFAPRDDVSAMGLSRVPGPGDAEFALLAYSVDGERREMLVGSGEEWTHAGVRSDAKVARFIGKDGFREVTLIGVSHLELSEPDASSLAVWKEAGATRSTELEPTHGNGLSFAERQSGQLTIKTTP